MDMALCKSRLKARARNGENVKRNWPPLAHPAIRARLRLLEDRRRLRNEKLQEQQQAATPSKDNNSQDSVNPYDIDYPRLGASAKRKRSCLLECENMNFEEHMAAWEERRFRRHKSTNAVHVNLQKTLEQQRPLHPGGESSAEITVDLCQIQINMFLPRPRDSKRREVPGGPMHAERRRKISRMKWAVILKKIRNTPMLMEMTQAPGEKRPECFSRHDILQESSELLTQMSALSCRDTNDRDTSKIENTKDTATFRPDLLERMQSLSLAKTNACQSDKADSVKDVNNVCNDDSPIDCDRLTAALKVCDETGEDTENIKEERRSRGFSNKFREYCTNTMTPNLKKHLETFLAEILRLQKKMYERDNVKGKSRRRYYAGIKEIQKHVELKKVKFVVIAPDLEKVPFEGSPDEALNKLIGTCKRYEVPYCFGLGRRKLGYYIHGKGFVSCIGIANYSGAEEKLKNVLLEVVEARNEFARLICDETKTINVHKLLPQEELILSEIVNAYLKILATNC